MEFCTRVCKPGNEQALSLVGQATILETYAGIGDGDDLIKYASTEMTADVFRRDLASDGFRAWLPKPPSENVRSATPLQYPMKTSNYFLRLN